MEIYTISDTIAYETRQTRDWTYIVRVVEKIVEKRGCPGRKWIGPGFTIQMNAWLDKGLTRYSNECMIGERAYSLFKWCMIGEWTYLLFKWMHDWRKNLHTIQMNAGLKKGLTVYSNECMIGERAYILIKWMHDWRKGLLPIQMNAWLENGLTDY